MSLIEALILGIVQGVTEFLPVSSSGHLKLGQLLFGLEGLDKYIIFDLFCHLGTLAAVLLVYWRDILDILRHRREQIVLIVLATLPLFPLVLILKPLKDIIAQPQALGFFFLITATFLLAGERFAKKAAECPKQGKTWRNSLVIGLAQALAVLPGVSRSGSTISTACLLGWDRKEAARFSFLISIPAIMGGTVLEMIQILKGDLPPADVSLAGYFLGFAAAFGFGYVALLYLLRLLQKGSLKGFAWYCIALGTLTLAMTNF